MTIEPIYLVRDRKICVWSSPNNIEEDLGDLVFDSIQPRENKRNLLKKYFYCVFSKISKTILEEKDQTETEPKNKI